MASFGKKIIAAFLEVAETNRVAETNEVSETNEVAETNREAANRTGQTPQGGTPEEVQDGRLAGHFESLLGEANIPGPDYYEFARMIAVMQAIPDEKARYNAAFAGLQVQGLNKQRLLDTAAEYLRVLTNDAAQFQATVDASYREKVQSRETEAAEKTARIQSLSKEIMQLQQEIGTLQQEVGAAKEKLTTGSGAYAAESKYRQQEIQRNIDKIIQYIH